LGGNIASQLSWVNLLYEILQEAIILPLFYFIGKAIKNQKNLQNKYRSGLILTGLIYSLLSILIMIFAVPLINFMAQDASLIHETATYIRLETVAAIFMTLVKFSVVTLIVINKDKYLYYVLTLQMILTVIGDMFLYHSPLSRLN
jgi:Na+-driven multidrug efflux pump